VSSLCHLHTVGCECSERATRGAGLLSRQRIAINRLALEHPSPFLCCGGGVVEQNRSALRRETRPELFSLSLRAEFPSNRQFSCKRSAPLGFWTRDNAKYCRRIDPRVLLGWKNSVFWCFGVCFSFRRGLIILESALRPRGKVFVCVCVCAGAATAALGQKENVMLRRNNGVGASLLLTPATRAPAFPAAAALIKKLDANFSPCCAARKTTTHQIYFAFCAANNRILRCKNTRTCLHAPRLSADFANESTENFPFLLTLKNNSLLPLLKVQPTLSTKPVAIFSRN
jgi:hypothetical protein